MVQIYRGNALNFIVSSFIRYIISIQITSESGARLLMKLHEENSNCILCCTAVLKIRCQKLWTAKVVWFALWLYENSAKLNRCCFLHAHLACILWSIFFFLAPYSRQNNYLIISSSLHRWHVTLVARRGVCLRPDMPLFGTLRFNFDFSFYNFNANFMPLILYDYCC